jgi:hypothetical protein
MYNSKNTKQIPVPGMMERPTAQLINSSMVLVSWKPPLKGGGPINYYEVTVIKVDEDSGGNETFLYNTTGKRHSEQFDYSTSFRWGRRAYLFYFCCLDGRMKVAQAFSITSLRSFSCFGFFIEYQRVQRSKCFYG